MARILGMLLRARDRKDTARFYAALGLSEHEHRHGGPVHHELSPMAPESVLEVYQASANFDADAVMVEVESIEAALQAVSASGITKEGAIMGTAAMRFAYIRDPDGRAVMLVERR